MDQIYKTILDIIQKKMINFKGEKMEEEKSREPAYGGGAGPLSEYEEKIKELLNEYGTLSNSLMQRKLKITYQFAEKLSNKFSIPKKSLKM